MPVTIGAGLRAVAAAGFLLAVLLTGALSAGPALGQSTDLVEDVPWIRGEYFIDFRARRSTFIGHTYIVYGRIDANGRVAEMHYAGLIPESDAWRGLLFPIYATVRKYRDDGSLTPTAIYRRRLSAADYRRVVRAVRYMQATEHEWHAIFQNCNFFAVQMAEVLGLVRPPSLMPPSIWVAALRALNLP